MISRFSHTSGKRALCYWNKSTVAIQNLPSSLTIITQSKLLSSSSSTSSSSTSSPISSQRQSILHFSLPHVHQHGWTKDAIANGVLSAKLPLSLTGLITPKELISYFMTDCNSHLRNHLKAQSRSINENNDESNTNIKISSQIEQIQQAIQYRLEMVIPFIQSNTWHEGMALGVWENTVSTSYQLEELVSILIQETAPSFSSNQMDLSGPMTRMALGGVYVATELHLLADISEGYIDTWTFLSHRMKEYEQLCFNGIPIPSSIPQISLPDKHMIYGVSAVAASLGSAVLSLALPSVRGVMDTVTTKATAATHGASTGSLLSNVQSLVQNSTPPTTTLKFNDKTQMNQQPNKDYDVLVDLPPFETDIGFDKTTRTN